MPPAQLPDIPVLSLFSGAGGMDYGFRQAGFLPVVAIDHNTAAAETFNANFANKAAYVGDLNSLSVTAIAKLISDTNQVPKGIIGGPPCQGFSLGNTLAKLDDPRNLLADRYAAIIGGLNKTIGIDFFVFENVLGLKSKKHEGHLQDIKSRFHQDGFDVHQQVLDARTFGLPQRRRRLFLVGINRKNHPKVEFQFPSGGQVRTTVRDAIHGLPDPVFRSNGMTEEDIPHHPNHWTSLPVSKRFVDQDFNGGRSFRRLEWNEPSLTVAYGNREIHVHPDGARRLTIFEAMLLQGFPKEFVIKGSFSQQVQQVSNAVPPPIALAVASALRQQLYAPAASPSLRESSHATAKNSKDAGKHNRTGERGRARQDQVANR